MSGNLDNAAAFNKLRTNKLRYVIYRLNDRVPFVEAVGETSSTWKHLRSELSDTKPAYVIYNYEFVTPDGRKTSKMYFLYWKPTNTPQVERIVYAQYLPTFKPEFPGTLYFELEDEEELENMLHEEQF